MAFRVFTAKTYLVIKDCEFHFKYSINQRVRILHEKGQKFKELATELLYAMTPESYKNAFSAHLKGMRIPEATRLK